MTPGEPASEARIQAETRGARIDSVLEAVAARLAAGERIEPSALEAEHPDLMPELGRRLRDLQVIIEARRAVETADVTDAGEDEYASLSGELEPLDEALPDYRIINGIHRGGQGAVYRAEEISTGRQVAIKVLSGGPFVTGRQRQRFLREIKLTARLRHQHIVTIYNSGIVCNQPYYVMEYVSGTPITDHAILEGLSARRRVELFTVVIRAVSHAHQRGIIHRDLKPSNILVDDKGCPHVLDFGLAKAIDSAEEEEDQISLTGHVVGTLPYLSPEQAEGADELDIRSDVYSLAVVLFELLTGMFPYPVNGDRRAVRDNIINKAPIRLCEALEGSGNDGYPSPREIGEDLEVVVARALAKHPNDRYQSADAFAADLERYIRGEAVQARSDQSLYILRKTLRRYRLHATIATGFLILLAASTAAVTKSWFTAREERDNAREATRIAHSILDHVVTEIEDSIRPLAGGTAVRNALLGEVENKLVDLQPRLEADPSMSDILAPLYEKRGDLAAAEGRRENARGHYEAALERVEDDADPQLRALAPPAVCRNRLRLLKKLARVAEDPTPIRDEALNLARSALADHPRDDELRLEACEIRADRALELNFQGRYAEARQAIQQAWELVPDVATLSPGGSERWLSLAASIREWESDAAYAQGDIERTTIALDQAARLRERLLEHRPFDVQLKNRVVVVRLRLARIQGSSNQTDAAIASVSELLELARDLVRAEPMISTWKRNLMQVHAELVDLHLAREEPEQAMGHSEAELALGGELLSSEPENDEWRRIRALALRRRGAVEMQRKDIPEALAVFRSAFEIQKALCEENPNEPRLRSELAFVHDYLGYCLRLLDRQQEALANYRASLALRETVLEEQPDVLEHQLEVLISHSKLATWHLDQRTPADNAEAERILTDLSNRVERLRLEGRFEARERTYNEWMNAITRNLDLIERRKQASQQARSDKN